MKNKLNFICIIFFSQVSFSQNIFNAENSERYARYLYETGDYISAVKEYEHLLNLSPDNPEYFDKLIASCRKSGDAKKIIGIIEAKYGKTTHLYPNDVLILFLQLLISDAKYEMCNEILAKKNKLSVQESQEFTLALCLLENRTNDARQLIDSASVFGEVSCKFKELSSIYEQQKKIKYKKPFAASVLSIIIPGLGKLYAGDVKNGFGIFAIVGLYAWQSYRGFKTKGNRSFYGWGFGALATGFYVSNIFGAGESAKRQNRYNERDVKESVLHKIGEQ